MVEPSSLRLLLPASKLTVSSLVNKVSIKLHCVTQSCSQGGMTYFSRTRTLALAAASCGVGATRPPSGSDHNRVVLCAFLARTSPGRPSRGSGRRRGTSERVPDADPIDLKGSPIIDFFSFGSKKDKKQITIKN